MTSLIAAFLLSASALAGDGPAPDGGPAHGFASQISQAETLGRQLHAVERAERAATEAVRRLRGFRRDRAGLVALATLTDEGVEVDFAGRDEGAGWLVRYRARVGSDGRLSGEAERLGEPRPLAAERARSLAVRERVLSYPFERCSRDVSVAVLPGDDVRRGVLRGYLLAGSERKAFAMGGNFRMDVAADGSILATRPFTTRCLQLADDARAVALTLTHLLDPHPTEIHVLTSLRAGKPVFVMTTENRAVWRVEAGSIRFLEVLPQADEESAR